MNISVRRLLYAGGMLTAFAFGSMPAAAQRKR
jgi:hypothetical protein